MPHRKVAEEFAQAIVEHDFAQAYALTTQGFQRRTDLAGFARMLEEAEAGVCSPGRFVVEENDLTFAQVADTLAGDGDLLTEEIAPAAFRQWVRIVFLPGPDDESELDACYSFWCLVADERGEDRVAHLETRPHGR